MDRRRRRRPGPGEAQLRADIQRSVILRELNELLPPSGPILGALARLDPLPSITGPSPGVAPPEPRLIGDARREGRGAQRRARDRQRLRPGDRGLGLGGRPRLVVTNAHVVAGEDDTGVQVGGESPTLPARVLAFDRHDDLAVLRVPGLALPAPEHPHEPAVGHRRGDPRLSRKRPARRSTPGRIGRTQTVLTDDAYGQGPVSRLLTPLRGLVRPGNSGGPLVDASGRC